MEIPHELTGLNQDVQDYRICEEFRHLCQDGEAISIIHASTEIASLRSQICVGFPNSRTLYIWMIMLLVSLTLQSCLNPFAPVEGEIGGRSWTDQITIGELLQNFAMSYDYRDSLHYADCLSESFVFNYFDIENGRTDRWFRDTDLRTTCAIFRNYNQIDLEWSQIPAQVENFGQSDTSIQFRVRFNLSLDEEVPIFGYARFTTRRDGAGKFQILNWQDDF